MKFRLTLILTLLLGMVSCTGNLDPYSDAGPSERPERQGMSGIHFDKVMILYSEGYNNLRSYLNTNFDQLEQGYVPGKWDNEALVVFSHASVTRSDWSTPTEPVVFRMYKNYNEVVRDTVLTYPENSISVDSDFMKKVMEDIRDKFPSDSYGLVYTSHGTGWIPKDYDQNEENRIAMVRSVGAQYSTDGGNRTTYQLDLDEFREAIPYHLDYLVMDACLMGGVEVVYEWKDICDYMVASPAEILADGFDYKNMASRLLEPEKPDLMALAEDFFNIYGSSGDVTVGLYDCSKIEALAQACVPIFDAHRDNLFNITPSNVQDFNYSYYYHFDFRDILVNLGATDAELAAVDAVLDELVVYKNHSDYFLGNRIYTFCGLSMFLPTKSWKSLNERYKSTSWNIATGFVK